jgi:hypothetical protein
MFGAGALGALTLAIEDESQNQRVVCQEMILVGPSEHIVNTEKT